MKSEIEHIKFPKIQSYSNLVKEVQFYCDKANEPYPILNFLGTTKLHGCNSAIVRDTSGKFHYQSRRKMISRTNDNHGFAEWCSNVPEQVWNSIFDELEWNSNIVPRSTNLRIFAEFTGVGIQRGVAISKLPKSFFIFGLYADSHGWFMPKHFKDVHNPNYSIYNIHQFKTCDIIIDFKFPEVSVECLEAIAAEVGNLCPVARELGVSGPGEGVIFNCTNKEYKQLLFKVKDDRFKEIERTPREKKDLTPFQNYVRACITEHRMEKVLDRMREENIELIPQNTKIAIQFLAEDIFEESKFEIEEFGGTFKDVQKNAGKGGGLYNKLITSIV